METDELVRAIDLSLQHSCCVDIRPVQGAAGYVRTVSLHRHNRVAIEFDSWGCDEGGLYFWATFENIEDAIDSVSDCIGRRIPDWKINPEYPDRPTQAGAETGDQFISLLKNGNLPLPKSGQYETPGNFWTQYLHPKYLITK